MGDATPDRLDLVCGACGTEFSRIVASNIPPTFDCPGCGESVAVPKLSEDASNGREDSERGFTDDPAPTTRLSRPEGEPTEIQEEDTAEDQETLEDARERSRKMESTPAEASAGDGGSVDRVDAGDAASDPGPSLAPGHDSLGRDFGGGGNENEASVSTDAMPARAEDGASDPAGGREEIGRVPHVGMDHPESGSFPGEESTEAVATEAEGDDGWPPEPPTETSGEQGVEETPATALDHAFEDTVPPEIGEETEAAIDEALDEEFEGSDDKDREDHSAGGPSSAQELVTNLREESGIEGNPDSVYDTAEVSEPGDPAGGEASSVRGEESPPPMPDGESSDSAPPEAPARSGSDRQRDSEPLAQDESFVPSAPADVSERQQGSEQPANVAQSPGEAGEGDGSSRILLVAAGVLAVVAAGGLLAYFVPAIVFETKSGADGAGAFASSSGATAETVGTAVDRAREQLHGASEVDVGDRSVQKATAEWLSEDGAHGAAARVYGHLWRQHPQNAEFAEEYVDALIAAEKWTEARHAAVSAGSTTGERETFQEKFRQSVESDDRLQGYDAVELAELEGIRSIEMPDGADTDGLLITGLDGTVTYVFSPATGTTGEWRDDIAAWRLCELIVCDFSIPETRPARIAKSEFESMLEADEAADEPVLYGSLRNWRSDAVRWPIEKTDVWRPWLSASTDRSVLEAPLDEQLAAFEKLEEGSVYEKITAESEEMTTREIAGQLSDIIVFDFLTNNWDRFADSEEEYGSFTHFADGQFVTLRTTTVFQRRKSTRVKGRFRWISRYDPDTIAALRRLEPDRVNELLYPDAAPLDRNKLDVFWEQRSALFDRVDGAIRREGRESVLVFGGYH